MIYYHGTDQYFEAFVLNKSRTYMDFGSGIYLSEKLDHAKRVALWKNGEHAYVYTYKVNLTELKQQFHLKVKVYPSQICVKTEQALKIFNEHRVKEERYK